jgi:DNA-binding Lrp family transcriptional regulator
VPRQHHVDATDARLLLALVGQPRASAVALSAQAGLSRNTVQARLAGLEAGGVLDSFERQVPPAALGYPLTAYITTQVTQRRLDEVADALAAIPEVLQVDGISGPADLMVHVAAADADDLYRIAGQILAIDGVERTSTTLVMRELVAYRITPLLRRRSGLPEEELPGWVLSGRAPPSGPRPAALSGRRRGPAAARAAARSCGRRSQRRTGRTRSRPS